MSTNPRSKRVTVSPPGVRPHWPMYSQGDHSPVAASRADKEPRAALAGVVTFHDATSSVKAISVSAGSLVHVPVEAAGSVFAPVSSN